MTTDELIKALRELSDVFGIMRNSKIRHLLKAAANRLEELDERVAIMEEGCKGCVMIIIRK